MNHLEKILPGSITQAEATIGGRLMANVPVKDPKEAKQHYKEIMQLNKRVQRSMAAEAEQMIEDKRRVAARHDFLHRAAVEWVGIIQNWEALGRSPRTLELWRHGLPSHVRPDVWALSISNALAIPVDLFMLLTMKANAAQTRLEEVHRRRSIDNDDPDTERPGTTRRDVSFCLEIDLRRTFGSVPHFRDGPLLRTLHDVITAYCLYRPEVGYVQGMSYLAAVFVLHMDAVTAFVCFANLLHTCHFPYFYAMDHFAVTKYFTIFDELFEVGLPEVYMHVTAIGVPPAVYLQNWFMTNYATVLPMAMLPSVWDLLLLSDVYFYKVGITIFRYFAKTLLESPHDEVMYFVTHIPKDEIEEEKFLRLLDTTEVSEKDLIAKKRFGELL